MVSRLNRILQTVRDIVLLVISVVLMSTSYGKWVEEPAHYVLFGIAGTLFILSAVNMILLLAVKVKGRGYLFFNSILQLVLFFFLAGLLPPLGIPLLALDIAIIITLRQKKNKTPPESTP